MKRNFLLVVIVTLVTSSLFAQPYAADSWSKVKANSSGVISLAYVETPSFVYKDASGKLTGICVDIMGDFISWLEKAKKVKVTTKYVGDGSNFRGMYDKVKASSGGVFGLGNVTITEERKREVKFSQPFITNSAILVTQSSVATLAKLEDLPTTFAGMTAYTAKGTLNEKRVLELKQKYFPGLKIAYSTTSQETLEKVFADPAGFAYLDMAFYLEAVQLKKPLKRHPSGDVTAEKFGIIMPLGTDWSPVLDEFFKAGEGYFNSSEYRAILLKHLGEAGLKLMKSTGK